jgi:hypothetical protein
MLTAIVHLICSNVPSVVPLVWSFTLPSSSMMGLALPEHAQ